MRVKRVSMVCLIAFLIGGFAGAAFAYGNHPMNGGNGQTSITESLKQAQEEHELQQFIDTQEELHPDGLLESNIETGSKYTGITYNGGSNSVAIATSQKEQESQESGNIESQEPSGILDTLWKKGEDTQNTKEEQTVQTARVVIQSGSLNVRDQNSTEGNIIGTVYKGETVQIIGQNGAWYQIVMTNGTQGYVSATYVEIIE